MKDRHRIQITSPTGIPADSKFLLDGKEIPGLCALKLTVDPDEFIAVVTTVQPQEIDVERLVERVFVSENAAQNAIGEQHAQLVAEHTAGYEAGSSSAKAWHEIATVIYDLARRNRTAAGKE